MARMQRKGTSLHDSVNVEQFNSLEALVSEMEGELRMVREDVCNDIVDL
jgi:hypothetical protein